MRKAVYVEWTDSATTRGWTSEDRSGPVLIKSIGWLIYRCEQFIIITTSESSHGNLMDQLTIPAVCIKKQRTIKT